MQLTLNFGATLSPNPYFLCLMGLESEFYHVIHRCSDCKSDDILYQPLADLTKGSAMVDRIGRRKLLLIGTSCITVILAIVSGLLSETGSTARSNAGVTFIFLFGVFFSFGWTAMYAISSFAVSSYNLIMSLGKHFTLWRS
jgi:hypothetical protein